MGSRTYWTVADAPDQGGRTAVVTGATSGIGFEAARALAQLGAHVVLAVRDADRGRAAAERIRSEVPGAGLSVQPLDLASLVSVRTAAKELRHQWPRIDLLINNAGVMWTPESLTDEGHELQFGVNHLGHFAFTGLLLDALRAAPGARVVTVSSHLHRLGRIGAAPARPGRRYSRFGAYSRSKLANLMFTLELQRRLEQAGAGILAVAAHPGLAATGLGREIPGGVRRFGALLGPLFLQPARMGALPGLRAATDPAVRGGEYYGPLGLTGTRGYPGVVRPGRLALDGRMQRRLWRESQELTGVTYRF
ncbi:oxidoreductase [Streptomyces sp. NPDC086766]|uniref:oxidoreductase n=1 Tax=Streptomyces sp. NPDC086766 TaxID=3365754 RepID=UPI0037FB2DA8